MHSWNCFILIIFSLPDKLMLTNYLETLFLAIIQGIFEFIPVSSSAHLLIVSNLAEFKIGSLEIDVSLHLGSLFAIIVYFRNDLKQILRKKELLSLIVLGSLPLIIVGYILNYTGIIHLLRNLEIIAWTTLIFGILLYICDQFEIKKNFENDMSLKNIIIIGLMQTLALIPGVSRSGIVITSGRLLKFNRFDSSKISFLLSLPALAGASFLSISDLLIESYEFNNLIIFSILISYIVSYFTIKYFLIFVKKFTLKIFVYYRIFLAFILFIVVYA